jgi:ABC-type phosphate transport system substrate-binding protein
MRARVLLAALLAGLAVPAAAEDFKVVVNASNPVEAISRDEAAQLFLKKVTRWDTGDVVRPVEPGSAPLRDAFYRRVAGKSPAAVRSYWNQLIFSGREVPPVEKSTDDEVVAFVRSTPWGIGYVSASSPTPGVKTISLRE